MNADRWDSLTERVLGAIFEVSNTLGAGFLEKVHRRALLRELGLRGIPAIAEASFPVVYKGQWVSDSRATGDAVPLNRVDNPWCPSNSWTLH
jgi:GxxExxY protein